MKTDKNQVLATAISHELSLADSLVESGDLHLAFYHLERTHVLGQASTYQHTRIHWRMFKLAVKDRSPREIWGKVTSPGIPQVAYTEFKCYTFGI